MGYEKCVTMCKKSIENLVQLLEQEEEAEARKRPKIIKLPDPTIFTITSPSQWTRNNLRSPDISCPCSWPAVPPAPTPQSSQPPPRLPSPGLLTLRHSGLAHTESLPSSSWLH